MEEQEVITVLSGVNSHAVVKKLSELKDAFIKQYGVDGVEVLEAQQIQLESLGSLLGGATLFASNRLVIIKNLSANKILAEQFLVTIKSLPDEVHVVLVESSLDKRTALYKTLKKEAELLEFGEMEESQMISWIQEEVKYQKGTIDAKTARTLFQYIGSDQARIQNEINKLLSYDSTITEATISELVEPNPQDTIFQLLELALSGKTFKALEVLDGLERAHEDPFITASMLIWQTHILAIVHSAKNIPDSEIAKSVKINPFVVRKTRNLANTMNKNQLHKILEAVAQCDVALKSTSTEPWRVVEKTVLTL